MLKKAYFNWNVSKIWKRIFFSLPTKGDGEEGVRHIIKSASHSHYKVQLGHEQTEVNHLKEHVGLYKSDLCHWGSYLIHNKSDLGCWISDHSHLNFFISTTTKAIYTTYKLMSVIKRWSWQLKKWLQPL